MKILLTTDTWSPAVNGVVRSVELLYHELLRQGHDVRVLTLSYASKSRKEGNIYYLGSISAEKVYPGVRIGVRLLSHYLDEIEQWKPDIIHSQNEFSTFIPACQLSRRCGCPLVHTYHTMWEDYTHYIIPSERAGKAIAEYFTRVVSKYCYGIIAPTEKIRGLLESYGVECPIFTVPTGIDLRKFCPAGDGGARRAAMRAELGINPGETVLVSVGRLAAEKNHDQLLELLARIPAAKRPRLVFVGDGPYRQNLETKAQKLGLSGGHVLFVGMVEPGDVPRWYQIGDAFVCASQSETQGLTYFEALACGLPAVCRADPCLDGVIVNGSNGWQWNTDEEFFAAIDALTTSAGDGAMAQNALATAARYSSEHFAQQVLDVYAQAINDPCPPKKDSVLPDVPKALEKLLEAIKQ